MHDRRTPGGLLDGQIWTGLGPPVDNPCSAAVVRLVARATARELVFVRDALEHSHDRGRYLLLRLATKTDNSAVYLAVDRSLARRVVVKIHRKGHDEAVRESQLLARLSHPNIVQVHDMGRHRPATGGEWLYTVFELGDCDLAEWYEKLARSWLQTIELFLQVGRGLMHLHRAGYVHRDIKPTNIVIVNGVAKIIDLGSVARPGRRDDVTGTPGFIAPEVHETGPTFESDVFSFVVTLWACLFLELPFPIPDGADRIAAVAVPMMLAGERRIASPRSVPPGLPEAVLELLRRGLDPDPKRRPSLEQLLDELQVIVYVAERRERIRRVAPWVGGGVLAAMLVIFGVGFYTGASRHGGTASIPDAALGAFEDPLIRAELAAYRGEIDTAMGVLYRQSTAIEQLSVEDSIKAAEIAKRIAKILERNGYGPDAIRALGFAVRLYERAGLSEEADKARNARERLSNLDPY